MVQTRPVKSFSRSHLQQAPMTEQQMVRNTPLEYSGDSTWIRAQII